MRPLPTLPNLLVDEGSRRLALVHLDDAGAARGRLTNSSDAEALHDYRVALRRLRSCLRAYQASLRSTVTKRSLRRLRRLARGTGRSRDLEVHLAWLEEQRERVGEVERPGVSWVVERLTAEKRQAWEETLDLDETLFPQVQDRLTAQLMEYRARIRLDGLRRRSTAAVTSSLVRATSDRLKNRLLQISSYSSVTAIHRARIAGKHLRYLLEPFADAVTHGEAAIDRLKALQDALGDVHDSHEFAAELRDTLPQAESAATGGPGALPGLEWLMTSLHARGLHAFDEASRNWLNGAAESFFRQIDTVADAIAGLVDRDQEVERKFLLTGLPPLEAAERPVEIEQGYLPGDRLVERVRRIRSDNRVELARTVKEGSGLTRLEVEETVTPDVFDRFWPLTEGRRLRKRRYRIADGNLIWEIDEFLDRDLVLAEVELHGQPIEVEIPGWLRPHVEREVTEDSAYSNFRLASDRSAAGSASRESIRPEDPLVNGEIAGPKR